MPVLGREQAMPPADGQKAQSVVACTLPPASARLDRLISGLEARLPRSLGGLFFHVRDKILASIIDFENRLAKQLIYRALIRLRLSPTYLFYSIVLALGAGAWQAYRRNYRLFLTTLAVARPIKATVSCLRNENSDSPNTATRSDATRHWLAYWSIYGLVTVINCWERAFINHIQPFRLATVFLLVWAQGNQTKGALWLANKLTPPNEPRNPPAESTASLCSDVAKVTLDKADNPEPPVTETTSASSSFLDYATHDTALEHDIKGSPNKFFSNDDYYQKACALNTELEFTYNQPFFVEY